MPAAALSHVSSRQALLPAVSTLYKFGMFDKSTESAESETGLRQLLTGMQSELTRFMLARGCDASEVEDLLQDLYVKLASIHTGPVSNPRAYLYQMANNLLHDHRRGRRRQEHRDDHWARSRFGHGLDCDPQPSPEKAAIDRDELQRVEQALAAIPARTADILRMYRVEGQTQKAIADILGISLSAVEKHLQRAYRALIQVRDELDAEPDTGEMEAGDVPTS